jgi:hypothetical protein
MTTHAANRTCQKWNERGTWFRFRLVATPEHAKNPRDVKGSANLRRQRIPDMEAFPMNN